MALKKFNAVSGFSVGDNIQTDVIDANANVTANNLTVSAIANLGSISNVIITGGSAGYVIKTDGSGNLSWGQDTAAAGGSNTYVQFNNNDVLDGSANYTFDISTNTLSIDGTILRNNKVVTTYQSSSNPPTDPQMGDMWYDSDNDITYQYMFDGVTSVWVDISSGYITASVVATGGTLVQRDSNGNIYATYINGTELDVIDIHSSGNANLGNAVTANYFIGDGSLLTGLPESYANSNVANYLPTYTGNLSPGNLKTDNILYANGTAWSFTTYANANVEAYLPTYTGNVSAGNVLTSDIYVSSLTTGQLAIAYTNGKLVGGPDLTWDFANSALTITNLNASGNVTANYFIGDGSLLTGLPESYANSNVANYLPTYTGNISAGNLLTDNLLYANGNAYIFTSSAAGSNTQVQFNNDTAFDGSSNFTFDIASNTLSVTNITANGAGITYITGSNVNGQVANAEIAGTVYTNAQPNITSLGTLTGLHVNGTTDLGSVTNLKLSGGLPNYAIVTDGSGNLSWASVGGGGGSGAGFVSMSRDDFVGDGSTSNFTLSITPSSIQAIQVNIDGLIQQISSYSLSGAIVSFASAPLSGEKIEIVVYGIVEIGGASGEVLFNDGGNIDGSNAFTFNTGSNTLTISGAVVGGNSVTANYFIGDGSLLTGLPESYANSNVANYLPTYTGLIGGTLTTAAQPNVTSLGTLTSLSVTGNVSANYFIGNGSTLTNLTGANVTGYVPLANAANTATSATTAETVTTNAQPNITSVGTLANLSVSGDATITGNLTVSGTTEYTNVTNLYVKDPIIELGGGANGAPLSSNDGKDRGSLLHYYTTTTVDAFMGWDNSNAEFGFGSDVSVSNEVITWNNYGNIRAGYFIGNGELLSSITGANVTGYVPLATAANTAGTVTTNAQPNITSVGTLSSLSVTGNVTANYFIGNGSTLTNITGANVTGYVPLANAANTATSATTAGTVTTNAQPNITSVGTLSSLSVTGNVSANYFIGNGATLTSVTGANVTGYVPLANAANTATSATTAGTVTTNAQPNITSVGTLSSLSVTGTVTTGNVSITGGILSNRANITVTTDTVIDQFASSTYRSAKYHISAKGTNGYQAAEVLLVHDGSSSYITIYGSICSNNTADIVDFSSNIVSGNVRLYATTSSSSTSVNLVPIYIVD